MQYPSLEGLISLLFMLSFFVPASWQIILSPVNILEDKMMNNNIQPIVDVSEETVVKISLTYKMLQLIVSFEENVLIEKLY